VSAARRQWTAADRGLAALVRLVLEDDWDRVASAGRLREIVADTEVLRRMAARVHSAGEDRASWIASRAALTLANALDEPFEPIGALRSVPKVRRP
jgi:hypothetical protein